MVSVYIRASAECCLLLIQHILHCKCWPRCEWNHISCSLILYEQRILLAVLTQWQLHGSIVHCICFFRGACIAATTNLVGVGSHIKLGHSFLSDLQHAMDIEIVSIHSITISHEAISHSPDLLLIFVLHQKCKVVSEASFITFFLFVYQVKLKLLNSEMQ